jgi:chlorophyllide a reductase subunit Y
MANQARFTEMKNFFEGVGTGATAGVWEGMPVDRPEFKAAQLARLERQRKSEEAVGC